MATIQYDDGGINRQRAYEILCFFYIYVYLYYTYMFYEKSLFKPIISIRITGLVDMVPTPRWPQTMGWKPTLRFSMASVTESFCQGIA